MNIATHSDFPSHMLCISNNCLVNFTGYVVTPELFSCESTLQKITYHDAEHYTRRLLQGGSRLEALRGKTCTETDNEIM